MKDISEYAPEDLRRLYHEVFEINVSGKIILEDMIRRFTKGAVTTGGIDAILKTYLHQGENAPIQYIIRQINLYNNVGGSDELDETAE